MSFLFKSPKMPPPPKPAPAPPPEVRTIYAPPPPPKIIEVPVTSSTEYELPKKEMEERQKKLAKKRKGRRSTILTGSQGVLETADVNKPQLLGGS